MIAGCFSAVNVLFVAMVVAILVPLLLYKCWKDHRDRTAHARMTKKMFKQMISVQFDPRRFVGVHECSICLDDFDPDKECVVSPMPCANTNLHVFHTKCIKLWLEKEFKCPLCKDDLTLYNMMTLKDNFETRYPLAEHTAVN